MFNSAPRSWAIELNTRREIPYLRVPMYSLFIEALKHLVHVLLPAFSFCRVFEAISDGIAWLSTKTFVCCLFHKTSLNNIPHWHNVLETDNLREIITIIWRVEIEKHGCGVSIQACERILEKSRNNVHFSYWAQTYL